jgi:hypothetical protein
MRVLSAQLCWPAGHKDQMRTLPAAKLVAEQVPAARHGLLGTGVAAAEAAGCSTSSPPGRPRGRPAPRGSALRWPPPSGTTTGSALAVMLDCYLHCADTGLPVHTWPVGSPAR